MLFNALANCAQPCMYDTRARATPSHVHSQAHAPELQTGSNASQPTGPPFPVSPFPATSPRIDSLIHQEGLC